MSGIKDFLEEARQAYYRLRDNGATIEETCEEMGLKFCVDAEMLGEFEVEYATMEAGSFPAEFLEV